MNYATPVRTLIQLFVLLAVAAVMAGAAQQQKQASLSTPPGTESPLASTVLARLISIDLQDESFEKALKKIAVQAKLRVLFSRDIVPANKRITLAVNAAPLSRVLSEVLHDTQLDYLISEAGLLVLTQKERVEDETGTIVGRVLEARTNKPLPGANVFVEGTTLGILVDAEGNFKIERVPPGKYKLRASVVGYGKISKNITIRAGNQTSMDFFLDETAVGLDEVVVTGVAFETRRREIPADIAVMTAKQIQQKNANSVDDLLKGEIPGVFVVNSTGYLDYFSQIYLRGSAMSTAGIEYAKIYIDGIEVSDPTHLSTISPKSIERVEVIRGPHAAVLYGAQATSGVIQIITKKGGNYGLHRPKISAQIAAGYIEANYLGNKVTPSGVAPLKTDNSLQISGGEGTLSYHAGMGYATVGEWIRNHNSKTLSLSGGMRVVHGPVTAELTALWSNRNYRHPTINYRYEKWPGMVPPSWANYTSSTMYPNQKSEMNQSTLGLKVGYQALPNWVHNLVLGQDNSTFDNRQLQPHNLFAGDTLMTLSGSAYTRRSVVYNTSYQRGIGDNFTMRLTGGAEYSLYNTGSISVRNIKFNEYGDIVETSRTGRSHNAIERWTAGYNGVLELGYMERLYLTLSSSAKRDPRGAEKTYVTPPRVGVSYSHVFEPVEIRFRGQYGSSVTPVNPRFVNPPIAPTASQYWLTNYDLVAERRAGWDAGVDLTWGRDASLTFTRFDEEGKDVIMLMTVDAGPPQGLQYQNVGRIGVVGYELQGKVNFGFLGMDYLTLSANYSYSDNRIHALNNRSLPSPTQFYETGDRVSYVPAHTGGGLLNVNLGDGNVTFDWQFNSGGRSYDWIAYYDYRYGTAVHRDAGKTYADFGTATTFDMVYKGQTYAVNKNSITRSYIVEYPANFRFGLRGEYQVTDGVTAFLNVTNLLNNTNADYENYLLTTGRTTMIGMRVSY